MPNAAEMPDSSESQRATPGVFATTHWSLIAAARERDAPAAQAALATLCQHYWYPLYAYVPRQGHSPHDAQDLTQGFFVRLLEKNWVTKADREKGMARTLGRIKAVAEGTA